MVSRTWWTAGVATLAAMVTGGWVVFAQPAPGGDEVRREVEQAERAFARTMADRDHAAFSTLLAADARFVGEARVLRGREEIAAGWKRFFEGTQAPFSWEPELVEVLPAGDLAMTSGPVRNPAGQRVGTFTSVWRKEADGRWRVIFDRGCPPCECK